ncbi:hypothetical protein [Ekhidna sp.]
MTRKIAIGILVIACSITTSFGQSIDEERMERDLKVAENILSTLASDNNRVRLFDNVESNFIPDYGVIFSIPSPSHIYSVGEARSVVRSSRSVGVNTYVISESSEDDEEEEVSGKAKKTEKQKKLDEVNKESSEKMKEQMVLFLADYADLIGQLQPSHRIVIQSRGRNDKLYIFNGRRISQSQSALSAQILKSDLMAYKQGKMNRDQLIDKISFTTNEEGSVSKDLELFSTIFSRLYESDLSNTYYMSGRSLGYTKLDGLGVTFNMRVYSSSSNDGLHVINATGETGLSREERDEKVEAMYPEFEKTFKENLLDYGRTIRSLKSDEMLIFKVKLTECIGCDMPEEIEVTVKGKTLQDYDKGSLSRDKAVEQVSVKKK